MFEDDDETDDQTVDTTEEIEDDVDQSGDADEADGDENTDDEDEGSSQDGRSERGRKNGYEKRIARLTRERNEAREALRSQRGNGDDKSSNSPKKPVVSDYDSYEDYIEAVADFKADQKFAEFERRSSAKTEEQQFQKAFNAGKKAYDDWDDVVTEDVEITGHMIQAIRGCDNPADVAYFLGSDPDEAARIAGLPASKQAIAIAKIDAKFDGKEKKAKTTKTTSTAPEPVKPNKGSNGSITKDTDKMTADEWIRYQNAKQRKQRG